MSRGFLHQLVSTNCRTMLTNMTDMKSVTNLFLFDEGTCYPYVLDLMDGSSKTVSYNNGTSVPFGFVTFTFYVKSVVILEKHISYSYSCHSLCLRTERNSMETDNSLLSELFFHINRILPLKLNALSSPTTLS